MFRHLFKKKRGGGGSFASKLLTAQGEVHPVGAVETNESFLVENSKLFLH